MTRWRPALRSQVRRRTQQPGLLPSHVLTKSLGPMCRLRSKRSLPASPTHLAELGRLSSVRYRLRPRPKARLAIQTCSHPACFDSQWKSMLPRTSSTIRIRVLCFCLASCHQPLTPRSRKNEPFRFVGHPLVSIHKFGKNTASTAILTASWTL